MLKNTRYLNYIFQQKPEKILIFEKITKQRYYEAKGKLINRHNFGNFDRILKSHTDHNNCMADIMSALKNNGIKSENIRVITTRSDGYKILKPKMTESQQIQNRLNLLGHEEIEKSSKLGSNLAKTTVNQTKLEAENYSQNVEMETLNAPVLNYNHGEFTPDLIITAGGDGSASKQIKFLICYLFYLLSVH